MNWQQFRAFVWLRWRLLVNQLRKAGTVNLVLLIVLAIAGAAGAIALFFTAFVVAVFLPAIANPNIVLYIYLGFGLLFVFVWMIGLMIELQRSEVLSLDKFLHLPVSLTGAFVINYLSSLINLTMLFLFPPMLAFTLGLAISQGPRMLLVLPLMAAFFLMVTGPTYQLQGWLATLMANPRRRRSVIVLVMMVFIVLCQLPNMFNLYWQHSNPKDKLIESAREMETREANIKQQEQRGAITQEEAQRQRAQMASESSARMQEQTSQIEQTVEVMSVVLPPGWLGLGARGAADGSILPVLLALVGMSSIGGFCLWRAYRTTLRLYTGHYSSGKRPLVTQPLPTAQIETAKVGKAAREQFLERKLPWVSEQAAVIALGGFRSLVRAPEAKLVLLTPIILLVVFGGMLVAQSVDIPLTVRPLMMFGGTSMVLLGMIQLSSNQFGFDRAGFRVFVLSGAPRREILLGKNLALAPLALGMAMILDAVVEVFYPLRPGDLAAILPQALNMFLLYCILTNLLSILAPMPIRPGSLKPMNPRGISLLMHIASAFLFPLVLSPALAPLGIELLAEALGWTENLPIFFILSTLELVLVVLLYRAVLGWEGNLLQAREQKILELVAARAE